MKLNALIFCSGLLAAMCSACGPAQEAAHPAGGAQTAGCDSSAISSKVVELAPGFDPVNYADCDGSTVCNYAPPNANSASPSASNVSSTYGPQIAAAYQIAPAFFQSELCQLDKIYMDTDPNSKNSIVWGLRERLFPDPVDHNARRKHIGIAAKVLDALSQQAGPYAFYETEVLNLLLNPPSPASPRRFRRPPLAG